MNRDDHTIGAAKVAAESYKLGQVVTNQMGETPGLFPAVRPEPTNSFAYSPAEPTLRSDGSSRRRADERKPEVHLTGIAVLNGKAVIYLSNGQVFTSDDRELRFVSNKMAIVGDKKFVFPPASSVPKNSAQAPRTVQPF